MDKVKDISFGFYTPEQMERLSTVTVTTSESLDAQKIPIRGGLYDESFGPIGQRELGELCKICGKGPMSCAGHCGFIDLAIPVYNTLTISSLKKLLNSTCFFCGHLKLSQAQIDFILAAFKLIINGKVTEFRQIWEMFFYEFFPSKQNRRQSTGKGGKKGFSRTKDSGDVEMDSDEISKEEDENLESRQDQETAEDGDDADNDKKKKKKKGSKSDDGDDDDADENDEESEDEIDEDEEYEEEEEAQQKSDDDASSSDEEGDAESAKKNEPENVKKFIKTKLGLKSQESSGDEKCPNFAAFKKRVNFDSLSWDVSDYSSNELIYEALYFLVHKHQGIIGKLPQCQRCGQKTCKFQVEDREARVILQYGGLKSDEGKAKEEFKASLKKQIHKFQFIHDYYFKDTKTFSSRFSASGIGITLLQPEVYQFLETMASSPDERLLCLLLFGGYASGIKDPRDVLFIRKFPVLSSKFRPFLAMGEEMFTNAMSNAYSKLIDHNKELEFQRTNASDENKIFINTGSSPSRRYRSREPVNMEDRYRDLAIALQDDVRTIFRGSTENSTKRVFAGITNSLDRKKGLFRRNIMGKRVNYCGRSVILPDPLIGPDELLVPKYFATKLTYPEVVTDYNLARMQELVKKDKEEYPGARRVVYYNYEGKQIEADLDRISAKQKIVIAQELKSPQNEKFCVVHRDIVDGDILLMNRQPSLHRVSMMAHKARVITNLKVVRFHYANCKSYNADFDGDEMNFHVPQDNMARAEAYNLVNNTNQYIVATSGEPIRGLIQDYITSAVLFTSKNTYFTAEEFQLFLNEAVWEKTSKKFFLKIESVRPAILKPKRLWTGKQIITAILKNLVNQFNVRCSKRREKSNSGLNLESKTKIRPDLWKGHEEECTVIFRNGELLTGTLDKSQIGPSAYGLIHACYEVYDPEFANDLLSCLSRVSTLFLQYHGFTCGLDDCLVKETVDQNRREILKKAESDSIMKQISFSGTVLHLSKEKSQKSEPLLDYSEYVNNLFSKMNDGSNQIAPDKKRQLDLEVKKILADSSSQNITQTLAGQKKEFPYNFLLLMTETGAKGTRVNASQIAVCLGQQEFDGKRVELSFSGRTLPSFSALDPSAMAGGYVGGRFLTGLKPQEYFYHTMAGRDGLIDTAVKTARSGYLQRSTLKTLESLFVAYDQTVRDETGNVIQFNYGGDSVDPTKEIMLKNFKLLVQNYVLFKAKTRAEDTMRTFGFSKKPKLDKEVYINDSVKEYLKTVKNAAGGFNKMENPNQPIISVHSVNDVGVVSERYSAALEKFIKEEKDKYMKENNVSENEIRNLANLMFLKATVQPGEPVGVIAAQSIGEPSTQMTLNTFHFSGMDVGHVTVGIPRLTELIMGGSFKKTYVNLPVAFDPAEKDKNLVFLTRRTMPNLSCLDFCKSYKIDQSWSEKGGDTTLSFNFEFENLKLFGIPQNRFESMFTVQFLHIFDQFLQHKKRVTAKKMQTSDTMLPNSVMLQSHPSFLRADISPFDHDGKVVCKIMLKLNFIGINLEDYIKRALSTISVVKTAGIIAAKVNPHPNKAIADFMVTLECDNICSVLTHMMIEDLHKDIKWNNLSSNDVDFMAENYGIESARQLLMTDILSVFGGYGIEVNERHVGLLADYLTRTGEYHACNRHSVKATMTQPFHKITFETASSFAVASAQFGEKDHLFNPSARIVVGEPMGYGTNLCDAILDVSQFAGK